MVGTGRTMTLGKAHLAKVAPEVPKVEYVSKYTALTESEMHMLAARLVD